MLDKCAVANTEVCLKDVHSNTDSRKKMIASDNKGSEPPLLVLFTLCESCGVIWGEGERQRDRQRKQN